MKIYVASSWRNEFQQAVVTRLRKIGHEVYDFRGEGFSWREVDVSWLSWSPSRYVEGLSHQCAERGFKRDMDALRWADATVMVMPCGPSASMEMGWSVGAGKPTAVYIPGLREPDLMVKMANLITVSLEDVENWLQSLVEI
jgi:hypothetical protein